jgi:hypothetical protein
LRTGEYRNAPTDSAEDPKFGSGSAGLVKGAGVWPAAAGLRLLILQFSNPILRKKKMDKAGLGDVTLRV